MPAMMPGIFIEHVIGGESNDHFDALWSLHEHRTTTGYLTGTNSRSTHIQTQYVTYSSGDQVVNGLTAGGTKTHYYHIKHLLLLIIKALFLCWLKLQKTLNISILNKLHLSAKIFKYLPN